MENKLYSSPVFTLTEHSSIHDALILMQTNFIKRIVVVRDKKPVGIVTERDINRFLENDNTKRALDEIMLKEIMKKNLITVIDNQQDHLEQCATRMETFKIGSIIVTDDNGNLAGITTQTDITRFYAKMYPGKYKVKDYMTDKVFTCRHSDSLKFALETINKNNTSRLVSTDNMGNVKGVITTNTFLKHSSYFKKPTKTREYLLPSESASNLAVSDLVKNEVLMIEPDDDLATAAHLMVRNNVSGVPVIVMQRNKLVGIVTKFDIVRAFAEVLPHRKLLDKYRMFH
ncbi:CBS domain-containing protein [Candidatus Nitrosotenuis chungbukensis]|uniref:CBS domain-containing protein n=1 Tax=Candidatus Nitrosotenuis chungbukensis TaxID=1353246 RepID=UPI0005B297C2|nr:CBS domain-containing protein [Candidatus Nitrosotenuis chungbukensis]